MTDKTVQEQQERAGEQWLREKLSADQAHLLAYNNRVHLFVPLPGAHEWAYEYGGSFETVPKDSDDPVRVGPAVMAIDYYGNVVGVGGMLPCIIGQTFKVQAGDLLTHGRVDRVEMVKLPDDTWAYMVTLTRMHY